MVIKILDYTDQAYTANDGLVVAEILADYLSKGEAITISFEGIDAVPSSFVNGAFVGLLHRFGYDNIKQRIRIVNSTKQINGMIKQRLDDEMSRPVALSA